MTDDRNSLNVKLSHGDVTSDDVIASDDVMSEADDSAFRSDDVTKVPARRHFTSSQSDIENCGPNFEETDYYRTSSRVSQFCWGLIAKEGIFGGESLFFCIIWDKLGTANQY